MDEYTSAIAVEDDLPTFNEAPQGLPSAKTGEYAPLAQYYGYNTPSEAEVQQLSFVWNYFVEEGQGPGETLALLRDLERTLAKPEIGQTRLDKLYSYIRLIRAADDTNAELRAYLR